MIPPASDVVITAFVAEIDETPVEKVVDPNLTAALFTSSETNVSLPVFVTPVTLSKAADVDGNPRLSAEDDMELIEVLIVSDDVVFEPT